MALPSFKGLGTPHHDPQPSNQSERLKFLHTVYQGTASAVPFRGQLIAGFSR